MSAALKMMSRHVFQKTLGNKIVASATTSAARSSRAVLPQQQRAATTLLSPSTLSSAARASARRATTQRSTMATATLNNGRGGNFSSNGNPFRFRGFNDGYFSASTKQKLAVAAGLTLAAQYQFGSADNFFEHKFTTNKNPDDLADFYGTEDFMEIFCVLPFMIQLMMRNAEFDDEGTIHAWGLLGPGELEVSVVFTDDGDDDEEIDQGDGETSKKKSLPWFNKRETFKDVAPDFLGGFTLWEMTQNFGFRQIDEDGTCEIIHNGEKFRGFFPMRLVFELHSRYVIWATERHINSPAFGSEELELEAQEQRHNIPLYAFKEYVNGLTQAVQKQRDDLSKDDVEYNKKQHELDVTLQRLKTISVNIQRKETNLRRAKTLRLNRHDTTTTNVVDSNEELLPEARLPRVQTIQRHNTVIRQTGDNLEQIQLVVDDKETKDALRTAMKQIEDAAAVSEAAKAALASVPSSNDNDVKQMNQPAVKPFIVRRKTQ